MSSDLFVYPFANPHNTGQLVFNICQSGTILFTIPADLVYKGLVIGFIVVGFLSKVTMDVLDFFFGRP